MEQRLWLSLLCLWHLEQVGSIGGACYNELNTDDHCIKQSEELLLFYMKV